MRVDQEIEKLKTDIFSGDRDTMKEAVNRLFTSGGQDNIDYLIGLLDQGNSLIRNEVAMTFMDNKFNDALEPLLNSINKPENRNARGTMVYALQALDCSQKLKELFYILFTATKNIEVQSGILTVLEEQEFEFTRTDLMEIRTTWDKLKETWNDSNGIKEGDRKEYEIDREAIQDFVDGYVSYLDRG
jgi:hypothetical protein